jgi:outer membrane lipopolysaccharide assembly protein LptE/RlpB
MLRQTILIAAVTVAVAVVSGCSGWHLRGTRADALPLESAYLSASTAPTLRRAVVRELGYNGVKLRPKKDAQATIELTDESFDRRVLSVDPDTGKVREVELGLEVGLLVRGKDGKILVPPEKLSWVQDFIFDESALLGTTEKAKTIKRELSDDAAQTILLRLETIDLATP